MVITTTLISLSTPRPLAMIPMILSISDMNTMIASKALNASKRNLKLLAKVFIMISVKKHVRNAVSTLAKIYWSTPNMSAIVSQKRMKIVYIEMRDMLIVSKVVDSSTFKQKSFSFGISISLLGIWASCWLSASSSISCCCVFFTKRIWYYSNVIYPCYSKGSRGCKVDQDF